MTRIRRVLLAGLVCIALGAVLGVGTAPAQAAAGQRVKVIGEVIDSWCYLTEIMYPEGTAHHQCALWCAAGGIPVGILADDGTVYTVLKLGDDSTGNANPKVLEIQSHRVTVEGNLYARDGINYLLIDRVVDDQGIVKLTHDDYGIQPFGE